MSPPRSVIPPSWINPKSTASVVLFVVMCLVLWPKSDHSPSPAEEAGYRVAKRLPSLRRENAQTLRDLEAAKQATDLQYAQSRQTIGVLGARIQNFDSIAGSVYTTATVDSLQIPTLGPTFQGDTLIPLRVVRQRIAVFLDTLNVELATLQGAVMIERGRASLAITSLQATIAAQDTVITGLRSELGRTRKPWYIRARGGVVAMGAGVGCGTATYFLAGPLGAVGGAILCSAIAGVR